MSVLPSSDSCLTSSLRNGSADHESFQNFYQSWTAEQNQHLHELISAANGTSPSTDPDEQERFLRPLINGVVRHYEDYYRAKSRWVKQDVTSMLTPPWRSSLEEAFMWIGGWRPSMAIQLLYSKAGLQTERRLEELIRGIGGEQRDLGGLSPAQLGSVDELQRRVVREEREATEKMAERQESLADSEMVELTQLVSELERGGERRERERVESERVEPALREKGEGLAEVMEWADDLRLRTIKAVIDVLNPIQAVHFLITAAELHLRIHEWGEKRDADLHHHHHHHHQQLRG